MRARLLPLLLLAGCGGNAEPAPARPPNLVLLVSDDHDPEHYGFAGHPLARTPALDRLAAGGYLFPVAVTSPRCRPTLSALLSGRYPHRTGVYYNAGPRGLPGPRAELLPALLQTAGYQTYAEGKLPEDALSAGFAHTPRAEHRDGGLNLDGFVRRDQDDLFAFLDSVGDRRFFVWWAPLLPHVPHDPPERLLELFPAETIPVPDWIAPEARETYREREAKSLAMVSWLDEGVAALMAKLSELGLERDTLVVYLADNGWANGLVSKGSPYEAGIRTPLILSWPGHVAAGEEPEHLASYLDVLPTLLDYAGTAPPGGLDGRSLRPFVERLPVEPRKTAFGAAYPALARPAGRAERDVYALYARTDRWKYVRWVRDVVPEENEGRLRIQFICTEFPERRSGQEELYDLARDPFERSDLSGAPEQAALLAGFREQTDAWWETTGGAPIR